MIISFWRYSHLALAISSSVFLLVASITGVILSFEPISNKIQPYNIPNSVDLTIAQTLNNLSGKYDEILNVSRDENGFVSVSVILDDKNQKFYIDPFNGEKIGDIREKPWLFKFATNLHRSLFLKTIGRIFIGVISFLLFLITISGIVLIIKRQGSIKRFFALVVKENFSQYYHVTIARLVIIPVIVLSLSGTYLSLLRFSIIPDPVITHTVDYDHLKETPRKEFSDFEIFRNTKLSDFRALEFPFSEFIEDYYHLKLEKKEVLVNQYTGEIISEQIYPFVVLASAMTFVLHTGSGSIWWSIILGLGSLAIPFLMYSGFVIWLKRPKTKIKNKYLKDDCKYVILVGSESGVTLQFANRLHTELLKAKVRVYLAELNQFTQFKSMEHLVVITSTYGQGEPPANGSEFATIFSKIPPDTRPFTYSVVGFGSLAYPDFCKFAYDADQLINSHTNSTQLLEVHTVNDQSFESFNRWVNEWSKKVGLTIHLPKKSIVKTKQKSALFKVLRKTYSKYEDDNTFLLELEPTEKLKYQSGDLLAIYPKNNSNARQYSIGILRDRKTILLSIKRHTGGLCSNYLGDLDLNEKIEGYVMKNDSFHFPEKTKRVVMISNGTGIAPFLGMIAENTRHKETFLYWGGRNNDSYELYKTIVEEGIKSNKLSKFLPAFSKMDEKTYVQDLIERDAQFIAETLKRNGVIMICGSIVMQKGVIGVLEKICKDIIGSNLSDYQNKNQIRLDCY